VKKLFSFLFILNSLATAPQVTAKSKSTMPPPVCKNDMRARVNIEKFTFLHCLIDGPNGDLLFGIRDENDAHLAAFPAYPIALTILADPRFETLWPGLLEWAGDDFSNARAIESRKLPLATVSRNLDLMQRGKNADIFQKSRNLIRLGYYDQAMALVDKELIRYPGNKPKLSYNAQWDWYSLVLLRANILGKKGRLDEAISILKSFLNEPLVLDEIKLNIEVNYAARLAETGEFSDALDVITSAEDKFSNQQDTRIKVAGSDREFYWIRACALNGLGKTAQAQKIADEISDANLQPVSVYSSLTPLDSINVRLALCMNDADRLAQIILKIQEKSPYSTSALILLQPNFSFSDYGRKETLVKLRTDPRMQALLLKIRPLPDKLVPAMNQWRPDY
jgi:tetratricopeptide (TPR) repeat protein